MQIRRRHIENQHYTENELELARRDGKLLTMAQRWEDFKLLCDRSNQRDAANREAVRLYTEGQIALGDHLLLEAGFDDTAITRIRESVLWWQRHPGVEGENGA